MEGTAEIKVHGGEPNPDFPQDKEKQNRNADGKPPVKNPDEKQAEGVVEIAHPYGAMQHFNFRPDQIIADGEIPITEKQPEE